MLPEHGGAGKGQGGAREARPALSLHGREGGRSHQRGGGRAVKYYPVYLVLRERPCLIIGGGEVAERKTLSLLEAGADVTIVSPALSTKLARLARTQKVRHFPRTFEEHDLAGVFLVIA